MRRLAPDPCGTASAHDMCCTIGGAACKLDLISDPTSDSISDYMRSDIGSDI